MIHRVQELDMSPSSDSELPETIPKALEDLSERKICSWYGTNFPCGQGAGLPG